MEFKTLNQELELLGDEIVKKVVQELIAADKVATGKLVRSIDYRVIARAEKLILEVFGQKIKDYTGKEYSYLDNVIDGRRKTSLDKAPPYKALIPWIKKRNIKFKGKSEVGTAIIISKSIAKKGIKGLPQIRKDIEDLYYKKEAILAKASEEDIMDLIDKLLLKK